MLNGAWDTLGGSKAHITSFPSFKSLLFLSMASRNLSRVSAPAPTAITGPGRTGPAPGGTPGWASGLHRPPLWLPRPSHGHSLSPPSRPFPLILGSEACRGGLPSTGSAHPHTAFLGAATSQPCLQAPRAGCLLSQLPRAHSCPRPSSFYPKVFQG